MIKKISLYGLCFNLGVAFGYPTQAKLEAFINAQGDNIEVTYAQIGETRLPVKVVLKDEGDKEAWKTFSKDVWFSEDCTESEAQSEMPAVVPEDSEILPEESQNLALESESLEESTTPELTSSGTGEILYAPKELSLEERHACFEKYSREATEEERTLVDGLKVKDLRFVDFFSIVNGLDDEGQKVLASCLIQKKKEAELFATIDRWVDEREVDNKCTLRIYGPDAKEKIDVCAYKLNPEVIKCFRDKLKSILKAMSHYRSARETLVLSLVLLKDLKFTISTGCWFYENNIEFQIDGENLFMLLQSLCHELNHALHWYLGIEGHYSLLGDLDSVFEQDMFRFETLPLEKDFIRLPPTLACSLWHECYYSSITDFVEISQQRFYRLSQMALPWDNLEEIWNIIGFANVDDCIYVNRMSDLNYMKIPALFHGRDGKFIDSLSPSIDLSTYPFIRSFIEKIEETVTNHIPDLCPTPEAWKIWLRLQGREDAGESYYTTVDKSLDELLALETQTLELIEDK